MPITKSAKKALRGSERKRVFNLRRKKTMNDVVKKVKSLVSQKNTEDASKVLPEAYKAIDKAVKKGIIKKNTASRKKSRLSALIKRSV